MRLIPLQGDGKRDTGRSETDNTRAEEQVVNEVTGDRCSRQGRRRNIGARYEKLEMIPHPKNPPLWHLFKDYFQLHNCWNPFRSSPPTRPVPIPRALYGRRRPSRPLPLLRNTARNRASLLAGLAGQSFGPCFDGVVHPALGVLEDLVRGFGKEPDGAYALGKAERVEVAQERDGVVAQEELGELAERLEVGHQLLGLEKGRREDQDIRLPDYHTDFESLKVFTVCSPSVQEILTSEYEHEEVEDATSSLRQT